MVTNKNIKAIMIVAMVFALLVVSTLYILGKKAEANGTISKSEASYATEIFGVDIISIEILADAEDWQAMLDNAMSEEFIMADVIVNGTKFQNVGIRPKGNSSLTQVAQTDSDRYSLRLQFNKYIDGQTCFGLESFVVNNMQGDNSYMKEYVSYDLMKEAGVDTPYFGFADMKVNGEQWGLYLAVEMYNDSYEQRVFGDISGMLYNVKSMDAGGNAENEAGDMPERTEEQTAQGDGNPGQMTQQAGADGLNGMANLGGDGRGNNGGSLAYIDDDSDSYGAIFNNVVGQGTQSDYQRVIEALKALSEGRDLETYFDVDQILRYLAAHTIVVNLDSYSSSMSQNYYIYERDGQLTILPWDYNLSWGGFQSGDITSVINFPIDTPVSGIEMESRPLLEQLFANEEYLTRYHTYLQDLLERYFADGKFEAKIDALHAQIDEYVQNDPTAFCTYAAYQKAVAAFITLGNLRAQSVQGQLDGTIPSTTQGQEANPDTLVSAGELSLSDLGSMGGAIGGGDRENQENQDALGAPNQVSGADVANMADREIMQQAMQILQAADGDLTDEILQELLDLGLTEEQIEQISTMGGGVAKGDGGPNMGGAGSDFNANAQEPALRNTLVITGGLVLCMLIATVLIARRKRTY
ncbi:MAG: CotH kinase family protein [Candidatus Pelethousia sp.]|nr:CotH kinase family protein [Candidatus Pelethousia sp.]